MVFAELALALAAPAFTGVTWLAYKHPVAYEKIYWPLSWALVAGFALSAVWDSGVRVSFSEFLQHIPIDKKADALAGMEKLMILNLTMFVVLVAAYTYLFLLKCLPFLISSVNEPQQENTP